MNTLTDQNTRDNKTKIPRSDVLQGALRTFVPAIALVMGVLWIVYTIRADASLTVHMASEAGIVDLQKESLVTDLRTVVSDIRFFAENKRVRKFFLENQPRPNAYISSIEDDFLGFSRAKGLYDQLRLLDADAMEVVRVNYNGGSPVIVAPEELQNKAGRYYFNDAFKLEQGQVFLSPLDLNVEEGLIETPLKPMIRVGTPVFGPNGNRKGIALANYFGSFLLDRFQSLGNQSNGLSYLLNTQGYILDGPDDGHEWGFMFPDRKGFTFAKEHPTVWSQLTAAESGQFLSTGGLYTFATVYPLEAGLVSSSGSTVPYGASKKNVTGRECAWKVVSFIPDAMLYAVRSEWRKGLSFLLLAFGIILGFGSYKLSYARHLRIRLEAGREELISELQTALSQIKTIQGIIPVCSYCKNIRDDSDAWQKMEEYISNHSNAQFSHGICPECEEREYKRLGIEPPKRWL